MSDEKQRAMMAAHLGDLAKPLLLGGDLLKASGILTVASDLTFVVLYERDYRECLRDAGHTSEQIDAAVASIQRGEWPADSVVGRVKRLLSNAENDGADIDAARAHGRCDAYDAVLEMLGG